MSRPDIMALTEDDLAGFTNIGTVRRARREVDGGLQVAWEEDGDAIIARWTDGLVCTIPAGATLHDGRCTCPAVGTICRHLLRTVLAYQQRHVGQAAAVPERWDPGAIPDNVVIGAIGQASWAAAQRVIGEGVLAEVTRSRKPLVRLLGQDVAVRFLVPNDLRYVATDLEGSDRARLIGMAILACRHLAADRNAGIVATGGQVGIGSSMTLVNETLRWLDEIWTIGAAGALGPVLDAGRGLETRLLQDGVRSLAGATAEVIAAIQRYQAQDARFAPDELIEILGEMEIRADVIRVPVPGIPPALVRGSYAPRLGDRDTGRFIGIGCVGRRHRRSMTLSAILQDTDTGSLAVLQREHADPEHGRPREASHLAGQAFFSGLSLQGAARSTLQTSNCRREIGGRLMLGRGRHAVTPQDFAWERLRDPVLVEDFAELQARLAMLPPPCLRARSAVGDIVVLRVDAAEPAAFDPVVQGWRWLVRDAAGNACYLTHPYRSQHAQGSAALASALAGGHRQLFVTVELRPRAGTLAGEPLAVVFDHPDGRWAVMPWCDQAALRAATHVPLPTQAEAVEGPLAGLLRWLGDAAVSGLDRLETGFDAQLADAITQCLAGGYPHLATRLEEIRLLADGRRDNPRWRPSVLTGPIREVAAWYRLHLDVHDDHEPMA